MLKKNVLWCLAFCIALLLVVPDACFADGHGMEVIANIDVSLSPRQASEPSVSYNTTNNEFMVMYGETGRRIDHPEDITNKTNYFSFHGLRVSPTGEFLGGTIEIDPPELGWKAMVKSAYNNLSNEYGVVFSKGPGVSGRKMYGGIMDNLGNLMHLPKPLWPTLYNVTHPLIIFNPTNEEYLAVYNDKYVFNTADPNIKNAGLILDKDGEVIGGPIRIDGPAAIGIEFNPQGVYNEAEGNYFLGWEDYRHVTSMWQTTEIYGVLLDSEGDLVNEVPLIDDFAFPNNGRDQRVEYIAYNSDRNEYLVVWAASAVTTTTLPLNGYISGRIFGPDGMPIGPEIIMATTGNPSTPNVVYVPKLKEYFMVWNDSREDPTPGPGYSKNNDIYARWLSKDGKPKYGEIPISIKAGSQTYPQVVYNSKADNFIIVWTDKNAPDDYEVIPAGGAMTSISKGDIRGVIYGILDEDEDE